MTRHDPLDLGAVCLSRPAERMVLRGLRGWLAGYETGDISCWEAVWNEHARELGPAQAKPLMTELSALVRTLRREACRAIAFYPTPCRLLCRDECLALGMVTGCQLEAWAPARAAACALAGGSAGEAVFSCGRAYAAVLADCGLCLQAMGPMALLQTRHLPPEAGLN